MIPESYQSFYCMHSQFDLSESSYIILTLRLISFQFYLLSGPTYSIKLQFKFKASEFILISVQITLRSFITAVYRGKQFQCNFSSIPFERFQAIVRLKQVRSTNTLNEHNKTTDSRRTARMEAVKRVTFIYLSLLSQLVIIIITNYCRVCLVCQFLV